MVVVAAVVEAPMTTFRSELVALALVAAAGVAQADTKVASIDDLRVRDADDAIHEADVRAILEHGVDAQLQACAHPAHTEALAWVVWDAKHVVTVDVGSADAKLEACLVKVLRAVKQPGAIKRRVVASFQIGLDGTAPHEVSSSDVEKAIQTHAKAFQRCYQDALKKTPTLAGRFVFTIAIDAKGKVTSVKSDGTGALDLDTCIDKELRTATFSGGPTTVRFPLVFIAG